MPKPTQTTELDDARRVLGMLDTVTDPEEYKKIFGVKDKDVEKMKQLIAERGKPKKKVFEISEENDDD